jgi:uncharacterized protein
VRQQRQICAASAAYDVSAQCDLGYLYIQGKEAPYDATNAILWFARAANQGNGAAENCYGYGLGNGFGVQTNLIEGYKWLLLADAQQNPQARVNLRTLEAKLSPEQMREGRRLAAEFKPKSEISSSLPVPGLDDFLK